MQGVGEGCGLHAPQVYAGHEDLRGEEKFAAAADLVKGKTARTPVAVIRGRGDLVGPLDLPGARSIVRAHEHDMFHTGAAESYAAGYSAGRAAGSDTSGGGTKP